MELGASVRLDHQLLAVERNQRQARTRATDGDYPTAKTPIASTG
jgi:hypothetical protein